MTRPLLDVHTHTIASGHAFSTLKEMIDEANRKGLEILGVTEHAPSLPGAPNSIYFRNLHVVPRQWGNLRLLLGAELNILNSNGDIDLDEEFYPMLEIRIVGIHKLCWEGGTKEQNTEGLVRAIQNPWVDIISHPGDGTAALDFEPVVRAAKESGTLLEINNSSLKPIRGKTEAYANNAEIMSLAKKYDMPVIFGSDAHFAGSIADYCYLDSLVRETSFPEELIINDKPHLLLEYLNRKRRRNGEKCL